MDNERKRHSHEYQDLFNNIPGGAFLCGQDEHCIMTEVNQGFLELTGFGGTIRLQLCGNASSGGSEGCYGKNAVPCGG